MRETVWRMCPAVLTRQWDVNGDGSFIESETTPCEKLLDHPGKHSANRGMYAWEEKE
jgi:hypothetical protein